MKFSWLHTTGFLKSEGYNYKDNGMVSYVPNIGDNEAIVYGDGLVVDQIYHYDKSDTFFIRVEGDSEVELPKNKPFTLSWVKIIRRDF